MKPILGKYNTLRNQILLNFLFAMGIVLLFVGTLTYSIVLGLITDTAENQIKQRAIEATGRMDSLYQQINTLSVQVATNSRVQQILAKNKIGRDSSFTERQILMDEINLLQTYSSGITSFELFTRGYQKLVPLDDVFLSSRIQMKTINQAIMGEGSLVWIGRDPHYPGYLLAIRQVSLMDYSFSPGGFLLIQIDPNYFTLINSRNTDYMILLDSNNEPITSNFSGNLEAVHDSDGRITLNENEFMVVKQKSSITGWTVVIITPMETLMKGVSVLRNATFLSIVFGFLLFLIITYSLSTRITNPIFRLTKAMEKRSTGDMNITPENSSTVEINELNRTYIKMVEEINDLIEVVYEKELLRSRTELKALQSQINPHFLFNTLNAIYWSLEKNGDEELAELIITMSELFRYTIDSNKQDEWVTIKQELNHIEDYMKIMKFRLDRFNWKITIPSEYENVKIPKLLIQPIVENAILHGISNSTREGLITISIKKDEATNHLICLVTDNGKGMNLEEVNKLKQAKQLEKVSPSTGTGIGISNVNKRLRLYYPNQLIRGIDVKSALDEGTSFTFEIPLNGGSAYEAKEDNLTR